MYKIYRLITNLTKIFKSVTLTSRSPRVGHDGTAKKKLKTNIYQLIHQHVQENIDLYKNLNQNLQHKISKCDGVASLGNMQILKSRLCESSKCWVYSAVNPPLVDEHAFPPTGFAVAWLGCTLHLVAAVE